MEGDVLSISVEKEEKKEESKDEAGTKCALHLPFSDICTSYEPNVR